MRVLITGASGMLGDSLVSTFSGGYTVMGLSRRRPEGTKIAWREADMGKPGVLLGEVEAARPNLIIHAAAMTNVDDCERDPCRAKQVNQDAVGALVEYCADHGAKLVYISTDAVFDGTKRGPYKEEDPTGPLNVYGLTKLAGELLALKLRSSLILRTNIFGWRRRDDTSFGEWVIAALRSGAPLTMFTDVLFSPISVPLFALLVRQCAEVGIAGMYHAGGADTLSKHQFAIKVAQAYGLSAASIRAISVDEKPMAAKRSKNMALDCSKLATALGKSLPGIDESIAAWKAMDPLREEVNNG